MTKKKFKAFKVLRVEDGKLRSFAYGLNPENVKFYRPNFSNVAKLGSKLFVFATYDDALGFLCSESIGYLSLHIPNYYQIWEVEVDVLEHAPKYIPLPKNIYDLRYEWARKPQWGDAPTRRTPDGSRLCNRLKLVKQVRNCS